MCEVLPPINESSSPSPDGENSKLEQLMMSMLEERDKLVEKLRESQEAYSEATKKLNLVETDNNILMRQLQALMPDDEERLVTVLDELRANGGMTNGLSDEFNKWPVARSFAQLARELAAANEKVAEKEEEVGELKSERSNTRLLLEHLECLVARHERSLRMTVIKRQTSNAGVSSEVEVLKALKSLFDHHKALDEKVRERLRTAQERIVVLEDELMLANQEMKTLKDSNKRMKRLIQQRNSVRMSMSLSYDNFSFTKEQLNMLEERDQTIGDLQFSLDERTAQLEEKPGQTNGALLSVANLHKSDRSIADLQFCLDERTAELEEAMHMRDEMAEKVQELEEELTMALSELKKAKDANKMLNESLSEQSNLQSQVDELQFELAESKEQLSTATETNEQLNDQNGALQRELDNLREEIGSLHSALTQKSISLKQAVSMSEDMMQQKSQQLNLAREEKGSAEHTIQAQKEKIERLQRELSSAMEREGINERNIGQLQSTVDRMLNEAKERLNTHSTERKQMVQENSTRISKMKGLEKELNVSKARNKELQQELDRLQSTESKGDDSSSVSGGVVLRNKNAHVPSSSKQIRYSWQVTDIDDAMERLTKEEPKEKPSPIPEEGKAAATGQDKNGEEGEWDVSQFVSMLESQVSQLDQQLETMGENMAEADAFDRVIQSVSEGSYRPSAAAGMETFPHSNPPMRKKKYHTEALPKSFYRVSLPPSLSPGHSPTSSTSSESAHSKENSKKSSSLRHKTSLKHLFRRKNGGKKNSSRRASAPVIQNVRELGEDSLQRETVDFSDLLDNSEDREEDRKKKAKLLFSVLEEGLPFRKWNTRTLVAWLEVWVGVPFWYIAAIRNCLDSGEMLSQIGDAELEQELGITNTLHRLKLRLAVQEIVTFTTNTKSQHRTTSPYGEMAHDWIGDYWLPSLGLSQYKEIFKVCLVDARMLEYLTKRNLRTALKMLDASHRNSLQYGITVLKKLDYNRTVLETRREAVSVQSKKDVMVWTNGHVMKWVESIGLDSYAPNLKETGVHGGVLALDNDFDHEKLAMALKMPQTDTEVRKQLKAEFTNLLSEGTKRNSIESQSHGRIVRKLSKRLKVGSRTRMHPHSADHSEFVPVRSSSPVLMSSNPIPLHMQSLLEDDRESLSSLNTTPSNQGSRTTTPTGKVSADPGSQTNTPTGNTKL